MEVSLFADSQSKIDTDLASKLISYRKHAGLSQQELAEALHVDQTTVSLWESAKSTPSGPALVLLTVMLELQCHPKHIGVYNSEKSIIIRRRDGMF